MFALSKFNGDIGNWDVSNVKNMGEIFSESKFNKDISKWNVSNVQDMKDMFYRCPFNGNLTEWTPYVLNNVFEYNDMFNQASGSAPIPYWINSENIEERKRKIDAYVLSKQLGQELSENKEQTKKLKL
jgi:surface protein